MKKLKLSVTLLSASLMAYSPVTSASMSLEQKSAFNKEMRENIPGTYRDLYQRNGVLMNTESRIFAEAWLKNFGKERVNKPQAQIVKNRDGKDVVKVVVEQDGKSATLSFTEGNEETFELNGKKMSYTDAMSMRKIIAALAEKDSSYSPLLKQMSNPPAKTAAKISYLTFAQFKKLSQIEKVEYLARMRETLIAASDVISNSHLASNRSPEEASRYVLEQLLAPTQAWAAAIKGENCIVAGYISQYEWNPNAKDPKNPSKVKPRFECAPFPKDENVRMPLKLNFDHQCSNTGSSGRMIACNPLVFGFSAPGGPPICQDSGNQPDFDKNATKNCDRESKLDPDPVKRIEDYKRILQSFAVGKTGKSADEIRKCFNEDNKVTDPECLKTFEAQIADFDIFKTQADTICQNSPTKPPDQPKACDILSKRTLGLKDFLQKACNKIAGPPVEIPTEETNCKKSGLTPDPNLGCLCKDGKFATPIGDNKYSCPVPPTLAPVEERSTVADKCDKGNPNKPASCSKLWALALLLIPIPFLFKRGDKKPASEPGTPPVNNPGGPQMPPPVLGVVPGGPTPGTPTQPANPGQPTPPPVTTTPVTQDPPTVTIERPPASSEGGTGTSGGRTGGVRTTK